MVSPCSTVDFDCPLGRWSHYFLHPSCYQMLFKALRGRLAHSIHVLAAILLCNGGRNKSHIQSKKATTVRHPAGRFLSSLRFSAFNWETFGLGGAQMSTVPWACLSCLSSRNCVGPPCWGRDHGRLPPLHPQQAWAIWVSSSGLWGLQLLLSRYGFESKSLKYYIILHYYKYVVW